MDITKNIVIQAVVFTDNEKGACKKTGLGMNIANGEIIEYTKISETIPYGRLFLTELNSILLNPEIWIDNDSFIEIKLITGQPNLNNVGKKLERILVDAIKTNATTKTEIDKLVLKDGRYTPRANDDLYSSIINRLLRLSKRNKMFSWHQCPNGTTLKMVKSLHSQISPDKSFKKTKTPKKDTPPLISPL